MALKHGGGDEKKPGQTGQQTPNEAPQVSADYAESAAGAPRSRGAGRRGGGNIHADIPRQFKRSQMGEILTHFKRNVEEFLKDVQAMHGTKTEFLPMDASRYSMYFSMGVLVTLTEIGGQKVASAFTMILEGSAAPVAPVHVNLQGTQVEVQRTAMNAWDEGTWDKTQQAVQTLYGKDVTVLNAGAMVVPRLMDVADKERVQEIIWTGHEACSNAIETVFQEHFEHFNIYEHVDTNQVRLTAQFHHNDVLDENVTGDPVRSDVFMVLSSADRSQSNVNLSGIQHQTGHRLLESDAFVDLVYAPPQQMQQPGQPVDTRIFVPRVVITKCQGYDLPYTPETFFLGIATQCLLANNYAWANQFSNFHSEEIHDIGAIGYRMKNPNDPNAAPQRIDTKSNNFGQNELFDLISQTCQPSPAFSFDCEDVGPDSWLTGALVDSAYGTQSATDYLYQALNNLTNGIFGQKFEGGPLVVSENNKVHLGTYVDSSGVTRDVREIDSLAVLSLLGGEDMNVVNQWEATFNDQSRPVEMRLEVRYQILRQLCNNLKLRGFAERVTFSNKMLDALVASVVQAGLAVDQDGLMSFYGSNYQVGNPYISQYTMGGGVSGMLNTAAPMNTQMRRQFTRW